MSHIVLLSDERVTKVPVIECGEILCDLRDVDAVRMDERLADADGAYAQIRAGIADRLVAAQTLLPPGLRLLVVEGYRPIDLQRRYFAEYCAQVRLIYPDWSYAQILEHASRYISPPEVAPHVAGAAVDLTVCAEDGTELPMGTDVNASPEETDDACYTASTAISAEARANRQILCGVLSTVGLVNYPTEWWHWSYGDRYWAYVNGRPAARYGPAEYRATAHDGDMDQASPDGGASSRRTEPSISPYGRSAG
jgi:zinc D-Ala-D-Ala dipeptidase